MKSRNKIAYLIIFVIVALLVISIFIFRGYLPKHNWQEDLTNTSKRPYGLSLLYELVKESYGKEHFTEITIGNFNDILIKKNNASYLYLGTEYFIDSLNVISLLNFAHEGNHVFISSTEHTDNFIHYWLNDSSLLNSGYYINQDTIRTKLNIENSVRDSVFVFYHQFLKETQNYNWNYLNPSFVERYKDQSRILSTLDGGEVNFIAIYYGQGILYFHTNPIFFSNYHLAREETYEYLDAVFDEVLKKEVIWDTYSSSPYNNPDYSQFKESPLQYVLNNRSLRWGWYTLLIGIIVFIILQSKRKQQIIPLTEKKENNTLSYAKAIGSLYFQTKNYKAIGSEMMNQFRNFIKLRYNIKLTQEKDSTLVQTLSIKSGIPERKIEEIYKLELRVKYDDKPESDELFSLYNLINHFYKNCH